jgi:hypothetical protein
MGIPTRKEWKALKSKHKVADGATKGVSVGEALDKYWNSGAKNAKQQQASLATLELALNSYITKIDKKKVQKDYPVFEKTFLDKYLGEAHKQKQDAGRYNANTDLYKKELIKFFTAVQALNKSTSDATALDKFRSGPVRGVTALGKNVSGVDVTEIDRWLGTIDAAVLAFHADMKRYERTKIEEFVTATIKTAEEIKKLAQEQKLA